MADVPQPNKKHDGTSDNSPSIGAMIKAVQSLPDMDEDLVLDACDFLQEEKNAEIFTALDVKYRRKWLIKKLRPQIMFVKIKQLNGKITVLEVFSSETIYDMKAKIEEQEGFPKKQQRIIFKLRKLEDHKTLADCGIRNDSELSLVLCLCGC